MTQFVSYSYDLLLFTPLHSALLPHRPLLTSKNLRSQVYFLTTNTSIMTTNDTPPPGGTITEPFPIFLVANRYMLYDVNGTPSPLSPPEIGRPKS